jgi:hypothetical protein
MQPIPAAELEAERREREARNSTPEAQAARQRASEEREAREFAQEIGAAMLARIKPGWAKAAIVAELERDESDSMTDYFHASTTRTVLLGWSRHNKNLFAEMRKAAATFPETAHLGPGKGVYRPRVMIAKGSPLPEGRYDFRHMCESPLHKSKHREAVFTTMGEADRYMAEQGAPEPITFDGATMLFEWHVWEDAIEHREKYAGYYLKAGSRYGSGWKVRKVPVGYLDPVDLAAPGSISPALLAPEEANGSDCAAPAVVSLASGGYTLSKHYNERKGFDFWLAVPAERINDEAFAAELARCKDAGGWYSRKWGTTPGGFAFKVEGSAVAFVEGSELPPSPDRPEGSTSTTAAPRVQVSIAPRLRELAESLEDDAKGKMGERRENTPKQRCQAGHTRNEGRRMLRAAKGLRALADLHDSGEVPAELAKVRSKAEAVRLAACRYVDRGGYYDIPAEIDEPAQDAPEFRAFWRLLGGIDHAAAKADSRKAKIQRLMGQVPGYFPTPPEVCEMMLDRVTLDKAPGLILEPSAGHGALIEAAMKVYPSAGFLAFEVNFTLAKMVQELLGLEDLSGDFMAAAPMAVADLVLMNPPFERGQDMEHVRRAFDWLKPGGQLVAIMSPGFTFRSDGKAVEFRAWFEAVGGEVETLPSGSFKASGTGIESRIVKIVKA